MIADFLTGLQFLTRIRIIRQTEWSAESFGRSVKYFPLIGGIIGILLFVIYHSLVSFIPRHVVAVLLVIAEIVITGGLHCDGLMDTMDGIFSGRSREIMLEIMKDSRVGANGVIAFCLLILLKYALILDMNPNYLPAALIIMPIVGRLGMVFAITGFAYARPDGIGKAFARFAGFRAPVYGALFTVIILILFGLQAIISGAIALAFSFGFCWYVCRILGGLTGDVYGAVTELTEIVVLMTFMIGVTNFKI